MKIRQYLSIIATLLVLTTSVFAQSAQVGTISGSVKDQTGAALPGVTVEVRSDDRGFTRSDVTDTQGRFSFAALPLGRYTVVASLSGFQTVTSTGNKVEMERTTELPLTMALAAESAEIIVTGEAPIVDPTNPTVQTRVEREQFEKAPMGRSYLDLMETAPGVTTSPGEDNPNVHGALSSANQYLFDNVDTTDPTTGTFGSNLNFEAIQEVSIQTSGVSAEYGRATGAVVNVITKSGTNDFEGSAKYLATNDEWNADNKTTNQVTGASLARTKFDQVNGIWSATLGGPIIRDRAWFFGAYEVDEQTSPRRQTVAVPEDFQMVTEGKYPNARLTAQLTPTQTFWVKYAEDPLTGLVVDYWNGTTQPVFAGELEALTQQDQGGENWAASYTAVIGSSYSLEAFVGHATSHIDVFPFASSSLDNGAPHQSDATGLFFNGATFVGYVDRPRDQFQAALNNYRDILGGSHNFKVGVDVQRFESGAQFGFPGNRYFYDVDFDPVTREYEPLIRYDFDEPVPSTSEGEILALYARDKFKVGERLFLELGARYEAQEGSSDVGDTTVETSTIAPRLSGSYDIFANGKTVVPFTYGRFYQYILQDLSDNFAQIPQQGNYSVYEWDGNEYVFAGRVDAEANDFRPNVDLDPSYLDEFTFGVQQQLGNTMAVGVRGIYRSWGDLIDDVVGFNADGSIYRDIVNYDDAEREYRGIELSLEKRFASRWSGLANYTYGETTGNHFVDLFSSLGDYLDAECRTTSDTTIGNNGSIPCAEVNDGSNKNGNPTFDRTHVVHLLGTYTQPIGPVNLTFGVGGDWSSGETYTKARVLNVVNPVTGRASGTATYFYDERGTDRLPSTYSLDTSIEATYRLWRNVEMGLKGEVFNVTDQQEQIRANLTTWCDANTPACQTARANYGKATARGSFQGPRAFRLTGLVRF